MYHGGRRGGGGSIKIHKANQSIKYFLVEFPDYLFSVMFQGVDPTLLSPG